MVVARGVLGGSALITVYGLAACIALGLTGCEKKKDASVTPAVGSGTESDQASVPARPEGGIDGDLLERLPSLARVEKALDGVPIDARSMNKVKLEEARAWIAANRPELSGKDAELAAQMLAIMDDFINADGMAVSDIKSVAETQIVQLWAMDADGDGLLSDEEARGAMDQMMDFGDLISDRYAEELDTNGDGEVTPDEQGAIEERMQANMMPLAEQMIERAQLANWDSDGDGFLSDDERASGEATIEMQDFDGDGEYSDQERVASYQSLLMEMNMGLMLLEMPGLQEMQAEMQAEMIARSQEMQTAYPNQQDFDLDGDGQMSEVEQSAFDQEMEAYGARQLEMNAEFQEAALDMGARMMKMQFDSAVAALDSDGDGRLATEEWSVSLDGLRGERDSRMFKYLYDADRSGGVNDYEVARFMDAYDSKSIYADADLNGTVDTQDLQYFVSQVANGASGG